MWAAVVQACVVVVSIAFLSVTLHGFLAWDDINRCNMTYMYQLPQYIRINLPSSVETNYPSYDLYIYAEGKYADRVRNLQLDGIPVLFLPGNAGSYRQARSIASVVLRRTMFHEDPNPPEFNVFTIDFDEQLSALYGGYLLFQTNFTKYCIQRIFSLYTEASRPPTQIVLIGHSMGGVIARMVVAEPDFDESLISIIITLSTPHVAPVVLMDSDIVRSYASVNDFWKTNATQLSGITLISIGGGTRDRIVNSELCSLSSVANSGNPSGSGPTLVHSSAPAINRAWASTDHLCIAWCNQIIRVVARVLFDSFDPNTRQLTTSAALRSAIADMHIMQSGINFTKYPPFNLSTTLQTHTLTIPNGFPLVIKPGLNLIPISEDLVGGELIVLGGRSEDWRVMKTSVKESLSAVSVVPYHFMPGELELSRFHVDGVDVGRSIIIQKSGEEELVLAAMRLSKQDGVVSHVDLSFGRRAIPFKIEGHSMLLQTIRFITDQPAMLAYKVALKPVNCSQTRDLVALVNLIVPLDTSQNTWRALRFPYNFTDDLLIKLLPVFNENATKEFPQQFDIHVFSLLNCDFEVTSSVSWSESFELILKNGLPSVPIYLTLFLRIQVVTATGASLKQSSSIPLTIFILSLLSFTRFVKLPFEAGYLFRAAFCLNFMCLTITAYALLWCSITLINRVFKFSRFRNTCVRGTFTALSIILLLMAATRAVYGSVLLSLGSVYCTWKKMVYSDSVLTTIPSVILSGMLILMAGPSLLAWTKQARYSWHLSPDPFYYAGLLLAVNLFIPSICCLLKVSEQTKAYLFSIAKALSLASNFVIREPSLDSIALLLVLILTVTIYYDDVKRKENKEESEPGHTKLD